MTQPKYIPMLYSTPMVQALLNGTKTQTRRIVKYNKQITNAQIGFSIFTPEKCFGVKGMHADFTNRTSYFSNPINEGDIIWVRETWQQDYERISGLEKGYQATGAYVYKADGHALDNIDITFCKWKPSIFMPKAACRIFLKVTNVRIERLCDISEDDAIAEGVIKNYNPLFAEPKYKDYLNPNSYWRTAYSSYQSIWISINGINSWNDNPYVWVYDFEMAERPADFLG